MDKQRQIEQLMRAAPVIPVVVIDEPKIAIELARALVRGGIPVIEITLRTARAMDCLRAVAAEVEGAVAGAGTVVSQAQIGQIEKAGAKFMVSPGASPRLLDAAEDSPVPLLPGAATPSEMLTLAERGYRHLKFFPAEQAGGAGYLKALASPLAHLRFCPTGGITPESAPRYLALANVPCVGGSWLAPAERIAAADWMAITGLAKNAARLAG